MANGIMRIPAPINEPIHAYAPGAAERTALKHRLQQMLGEQVEIPVIIGGKTLYTGVTTSVVCPHDHGHVLAIAHQAGAAEVQQAVLAARAAWQTWSEMAWEARAAVFLKAAELLAGPWRDTLNAATMLNQSKTVFQAEIDSACELIDFWRFNPYYMWQMYAEQPSSMRGIWDYAEYRPLEGFIFAVTPFNFTSIAGNLPTAPALMGNTVLWKPASSALLPAYYLMQLLAEAGLPPGVINFLPGRGGQVGNPVLAYPEMAGVHFTGSTAVWQGMWQHIGANIAHYKSYPRIVGETGGKDFVFAHHSADLPSLVTGLVRGAFEFQGQKCSAASRAYIPRSLWPAVRGSLEQALSRIRMGSPLDFRNFMSAVIDGPAFDNIMSYIGYARGTDGFELVCGGHGDKSVGYFIEPTVIVSRDPVSTLMREEIFGPVLTVYVYEDTRLDEALHLCDTGSPYALTGSIFARDRAAIVTMSAALRHAAGNFYINDKPTGAVVGQQPFGGSRASGSNDKAGSILNLLRWTSQRTVKENFVPPTDFPYPHMGEE
ncbi:MAG: L-glutamate gamma-semialdehyde dehydrogenase [Deltaproteobacteria bacterium]|nr:L-glutamate gamma-semialdehyde dehydrogenase [Deltaproteobacteria bacterium]